MANFLQWEESLENHYLKKFQICILNNFLLSKERWS